MNLLNENPKSLFCISRKRAAKKSEWKRSRLDTTPAPAPAPGRAKKTEVRREVAAAVAEAAM